MRTILLCCLAMIAATQGYARGQAAPPAPLAEGKYICVKDGHLSYDGERIRLWGTNFCASVKREGADLDLSFDRLADVGFNGIRINLFDGQFVSKDAPNTYTLRPYTKGDNSGLDLLNRSVHLARQRGMFFWMMFCRSRVPAVENDYDVMPAPDAQTIAAGLDGPREEWAQLLKDEDCLNMLVYFDARAERVHREFARAVLEQVNPYTGRRWADEEAIGLWEIFNENTFVERAISTAPTGIVKKRLTARWNAWLKDRYKTDEGLLKAWGQLNEGESLADGTVAYAPTKGGVETSGAGVQKEYVAKDATLGTYPYARGEDVIRFVLDLYTGHTQRFIAFCRSLGKPGVGISVAPICPSGRFGASLQNYCAASSGDYCATGVYGFAMRPWEVEADEPFYPFVVRVNSHPLMEQPIDLVRVPDKPYLVYECNDYRPNPYMVEFHTRMLAYAAWQDYDGVFWFNWDDAGYLGKLSSDQDYVTTRMPIPDSNYPNAALILANDEAALASLKAAGAAFKAGAIQPAPNPVIMTFGKDILLNLVHPGFGSLENIPELTSQLRPVVWRRGMRTVFDPDRPSKLPKLIRDEESRIDMPPYVTFDWSNDRGFIRVNAPTAKIHTGFLPPVLEFGDDVTIRHIDRQWGTIALVAEDGQPLPQSRSILVVAISRNMNKGMRVTPERLSTKSYWQEGLAQMCGEPGSSPPIVDRVGCLIYAPWLAGMTYEKRDFARQPFDDGNVNGKFELRGYEPTFYARLIRPEPTQDR